MRALIPAVAILLAAGAAQAQAPSRDTPTTIVCLEPGGQSVPPTCHVPASRLDQKEFICQCFGTGLRTVVPVCPAGVDPPPETGKLNKARREGAKAGSLVGATYEGRPICVAPRSPLR
ncbi:hypothetical protein [Phenylobacterium sp. J367]|uniref:hypothetical protein n=1 Tax=Phenylobacterium sp. J367 TaxID=2898435 RepID=UPI00215094C1|nr:hypothetical protein [Phenylobacterium sp. J367]MCR5881162.1 hypothetical protein [Phenylobacterium sp. J367]